MSGERFFSTLVSVGVLFAAGMFVMLTSLAALNAASLSAGRLAEVAEALS